MCMYVYMGFPAGSAGKESAYNVGDDPFLIPGSRRPPGEGNGKPLQSFFLGESQMNLDL